MNLNVTSRYANIVSYGIALLGATVFLASPTFLTAVIGTGLLIWSAERLTKTGAI